MGYIIICRVSFCALIPAPWLILVTPPKKLAYPHTWQSSKLFYSPVVKGGWTRTPPAYFMVKNTWFDPPTLQLLDLGETATEKPLQGVSPARWPRSEARSSSHCSICCFCSASPWIFAKVYFSGRNLRGNLPPSSERPQRWASSSILGSFPLIQPIQRDDFPSSKMLEDLHQADDTGYHWILHFLIPHEVSQ